jgi:NADPH:quinone reductase-like Zn-dependent oxidoreductase
VKVVIHAVGGPWHLALTDEVPLALGASRVVNTESEDFEKAALDLTSSKGVDLAIDSCGRRVPLAEAAEMHRRLEGRHVAGKLLLKTR